MPLVTFLYQLILKRLAPNNEIRQIHIPIAIWIFFLSAQEFIFYYYYSLLPYTKYTEMDIMELYNLMSISQVLETTVLACDSEVLYQ